MNIEAQVDMMPSEIPGLILVHRLHLVMILSCFFGLEHKIRHQELRGKKI